MGIKNLVEFAKALEPSLTEAGITYLPFTNSLSFITVKAYDSEERIKRAINTFLGDADIYFYDDDVFLKWQVRVIG